MEVLIVFVIIRYHNHHIYSTKIYVNYDFYIETYYTWGKLEYNGKFVFVTS